MEAVTLSIYNTQGKETDKIKLNSAIFDGKVNAAAVYQVIKAYRANQRKGLASTKTRGEVSGGGRKPWKQKGTGRARVGSTRSPLWRHGGVVFGPHPRSFYNSVPKKIKALALKSALNAKLKEGNITVLDSLMLQDAKTKTASMIFSNLKLSPTKKESSQRLLLLLDKLDKNLGMALANIGFLDVNLARDTHAFEVMSHCKLIITKDGLNELTDRLKIKQARIR